MSGLEVLGLVLGGLPLVISALQNYKRVPQGIGRWRRYTSEIASIIRQLQSQECILTDLCEKLLEDLGLGSRIDAMIKEPFGPLWQDDGTKERLRQLLYRDYTVFQETIKEMSIAMDDLKKRIGLGPDGEMNGIDITLWKRELKRFSFTFNRSEYADLMRILRDGNECLESLIRHNKDLEPRRKQRFQTRELGLLRVVSQNVFRALQNSIACSCNHALGLELCPVKRHGELKEHDCDIVSGFEFRVGISGAGLSWNIWKELLLLPSIGIQDSQKTSISSSRTLVSPSSIKVQKSYWRRFRRSSSVSIHSEQDMTCAETNQVDLTPPQSPETTDKSTKLGINPPSIPIDDICSTIVNSNRPASSFYGSISTYHQAKFSNFDVHTATTSNGHGSDLITLDQVLRRNDSSSNQLSYTQKIRLVYLVSTAVLQIPESSWWTDTSLSRDIIFIQKQGFIDFQRVFIGRDAVDQTPPALLNKLMIDPRRHVRNPALLALAIVLVEIMLARPFEELRAETTPWNVAAITDARSDLEAAQKLAHRVHNEFGSMVGSAIRRCVTGDFDCANISLEDEEFRQEFNAGVVALLKDNMKYAGLS
ncbi:hypothetical protein PFICI_09284 [Pestalotiopsis fici W106-1]|uniref:DUF7580 domain-containing protein n=1 Tax=Pestalotiopsis fici (strain W106-1 / CGMCC3.15140) TaxID=1229662 RepID=W3X2P6_PESFW|nr:uncharacterized protein PFICI_09284 [Pestalotiopsis fici W106-1]ETS79431.1 hypothetical protein PFICI_09284 [Pestalotiopsis fici W106-1]